MTTDTLRRHSKEELREQVGSVFQCAVAEGVFVPAVFTDMEDGPTARGTEQFALHFTLPPGTPPVQRIYDMEHPALGPVQWFLVPIGSDADGLQVEAAFNRRIDVASPEG